MKDWKLAIHIRDKYTCQHCGEKEDPQEKTFQVHHIIPKSEGGSNHQENLILTCPYCHKHYYHGQSGVEYYSTTSFCSFERDMAKKEKRKERYERRYLRKKNRIAVRDRKEEKRKLLGYKGGI